MSKKNVIWLASYPKSGNTWFRVFLTNLLYETEVPAHINDLAETSIASSRKIFDEYTGLSSSDLTFDEIDKLRPEVYRMQSEESSDLLFKKVHDKFYLVDKNQALFPPEITCACIYFIRNPLDVAVSFAYHSARDVQRMVKVLNDSDYAFCDNNDRLPNQLRQLLGTWSEHVISWTTQKLIKVHVVRYEDMKQNTFDTFKKAVQFIGIEKSDKQIKTAIEKSDFKILAQQEQEKGFKEKMIKSKSFFRKGEIGDWRNYLDEKMKNEIIKNHKKMMQYYGYLNNNGELVF